MVFQGIKLDNELFTHEELIGIKRVLITGEFTKLMNVLDEITPVKELAIQNFMNELGTGDMIFESEVREQMKRELPNGPQTPEEEAEWEAKLQAEFAAHQEKMNRKKNKIAAGLAGKQVPGDLEEIATGSEEIGNDEDIMNPAPKNKGKKKTEPVVEEPKSEIKKVDPAEVEAAKAKMINPNEEESEKEEEEDEDEGMEGTKFNKLVPTSVTKSNKKK